ncbi:hypothetical protein MBRA1_002302 [Malassezia brasiliensis]|uniref:Rad21/Rec8-like protein N-terminal domain-containing protein n=1 Tax=Malassezia brasiliensis TaxID=1821822 RepID=A0AAF0DX41_9BASI|nr:hypothetical protein MBRA1_002302 [Malassezia brasiliensis]
MASSADTVWIAATLGTASNHVHLKMRHILSVDVAQVCLAAQLSTTPRMLVQASFVLLGAARILHAQLEAWARDVRRTAREWKRCQRPRAAQDVQTTEAQLRHLLRKAPPVSSYTYALDDIATLLYDPVHRVPARAAPAHATLLAPHRTPPSPTPPRTDHAETSWASTELGAPLDPGEPMDLDLLVEEPRGVPVPVDFIPDRTPQARADLSRLPVPAAAPDADYRAVCVHAAAQRSTAGRHDRRIGYTPEEWARRCIPPHREPAFYTIADAAPHGPIAWLCTCTADPGTLTSPHREPLWQRTVGQRLASLAAHFRHCAQVRKHEWAAQQHATHDAEPMDLAPLEPSELPPPSPEVGRALDTSDGDLMPAVYPWSQLGAAPVPGRSTPSRSDTYGNESFASVLHGAYSLPSPDLSRELFELRRPRESSLSTRLASPVVSARSSLVPSWIGQGPEDARFDVSEEPEAQVEPDTHDFLVYPTLVLWHLLVLATAGALRLHQTHAYGPIGVHLREK